jgi:hypothetical protein
MSMKARWMCHPADRRDNSEDYAARMSLENVESVRRLTLAAQIDKLQQALEANEKSWKACGLPTASNSVADGIRRDLAEKLAQLHLDT